MFKSTLQLRILLILIGVAKSIGIVNTSVTPGLLQKKGQKSVTVRGNFRVQQCFQPYFFRKFDKKSQNITVRDSARNSPTVMKIYPRLLKNGVTASDSTFGWSDARDSLTVYYTSLPLEHSHHHQSDHSHTLVPILSTEVQIKLETTLYKNIPYTQCNSEEYYRQRLLGETLLTPGLLQFFDSPGMSTVLYFTIWTIL